MVEVFFTAQGPDRAFEVAAERSGRWFDPSLVDALQGIRDDEQFWASLAGGDVGRLVAGLEPAALVMSADETRLDRVAEAFALVIDAKSPFTFRHSERVAEFAAGAALGLGFGADELRDLRRAALLHDIGKLAISNRYPLGLSAAELGLPARILVVSDIYEALTARRPYREPMSSADALALMRADLGRKLCPDAFAALERHVAGTGRLVPRLAA